ncbi:MAG: PaaI family thioesterase [Sphingosinicella sp.]|nr:PaaI family thioesterase [Sphingosinicella sp.]
MLVRAEGEGRARCRMFPEGRHGNLGGMVHGGAILTFIDTAMFAGGRLAGISDLSNAVTLDLNAQFIAPAVPGKPLDVTVELLRETRRLAFMRGIVEQEGEARVAWSGCMRKGSAPR